MYNCLVSCVFLCRTVEAQGRAVLECRQHFGKCGLPRSAFNLGDRYGFRTRAKSRKGVYCRRLSISEELNGGYTKKARVWVDKIEHMSQTKWEEASSLAKK